MASARYQMRPVKTFGLAAMPSLEAPEGASETYLRGAVLVNDGSGRLQEGGANPTSIVGVADRAGQNNATEGAVNTQYTPCLPGVVFEASVDNTGAGTGVTATTDLFAEYGITQDSDGIWYVDKDKTGANARFRILEIVGTVGETMGRVRGVFTYDATLYAAS